METLSTNLQLARLVGVLCLIILMMKITAGAF